MYAVIQDQYMLTYQSVNAVVRNGETVNTRPTY